MLNPIDPVLFEAGLLARATALRPDAAEVTAIDGKTLRRAGDSGAGQKPLHLASA